MGTIHHFFPPRNPTLCTGQLIIFNTWFVYTDYHMDHPPIIIPPTESCPMYRTVYYNHYTVTLQIIAWIIHSTPSVGIGATQCKLQHYKCLTTTVGRHGG